MIDCVFFFFKQKTAYEMRISDWSSDVCSSDLQAALFDQRGAGFANAFFIEPFGHVRSIQRIARCPEQRAGFVEGQAHDGAVAALDGADEARGAALDRIDRKSGV